MTLNQMRQFLVVSKFMNISRAAEALIISHSTISRSISMLEEELGVQLLIRTNKTIGLTEAGAQFAKRCEEILSLVDQAVAEMRDVSESLQQKLRVDVVSMENADVVNGYNQFVSRYPNITLLVDEVALKEGIENLKTRKCDAFITFSYCLNYLGDQFEKLDLFPEDFKAVVPRNSAWSDLPYLEVSQMKTGQAPLLLIDAGFSLPRQIADPNSFMVSTVAENRSEMPLSTVLLKVQAGTGWAMLPDCVARKAHGCKLLDIHGADTSHYISIIWEKNTQKPSLNTFLDLFRGLFPRPNSVS